MSAEEFRVVPSFSDYEISNLGRVISHKTWRGVAGPREMSAAIASNGYRMVRLSNGEYSRAPFFVHHLVALTFIGPRPTGSEIRHLDGNPLNNSLANLSYGTKADNMADSVAHGTHAQASKTHCKRGHEFTAENTGWHGPDGRYRRCLTCNAATSRQSYERRLLRSAGVRGLAA